MSDLISRSELINALKVHFDSCFREDGELLYSDHICTSDDVVDLIKLVENQPTAYSVDKVVEELEERTDFLKDCTKYGNKNAKQQAKSYSTMMMYEVADLVDDLLEIVKQGGVSDDVCEWRLCDEEANVYDTSCRNPHILTEWLEELKDYRDKNKMVVHIDIENMDSIKDKIEELSKYAENQYNKAIDDFAEKLSLAFDETIEEHGFYPENLIRQVAEQLKAGGTK